MSREIAKGEKGRLADRRAAEEVVQRLGLEDLRFLNRIIVDRIQRLMRISEGMELLKFTPGDRVRFTSGHGEELQGTVIRINRKTVSVRAADASGWWNVSPGLLTKLQ
jgi:hypothetical protein